MDYKFASSIVAQSTQGQGRGGRAQGGDVTMEAEVWLTQLLALRVAGRTRAKRGVGRLWRLGEAREADFPPGSPVLWKWIFGHLASRILNNKIVPLEDTNIKGLSARVWLGALL